MTQARGAPLRQIFCPRDFLGYNDESDRWLDDWNGDYVLITDKNQLRSFRWNRLLSTVRSLSDVSVNRDSTLFSLWIWIPMIFDFWQIFNVIISLYELFVEFFNVFFFFSPNLLIKFNTSFSRGVSWIFSFALNFIGFSIL